MNNKTRKKKRLLPRVSDIPFFEKGQIIPRDVKDKYHLNGNAYRQAFARGIGGFRTEETWNKKIHTCCKSKSYWRHRSNCPKIKF